MDLKLTHLDWNPEATLIHFQGQYLTICELDYNILQREIQNIPKNKAAVDIGEFCLVEDLSSACWFRGRVQNRKEDLFDIFLIDHGNVLSVDKANISTCPNDLFSLPPKVVCGFLANVLLLPSCPDSVVEKYFSNLIGRNVTGYIQALLPHKVLLLEIPNINIDLVNQGFGRNVDTDTFCLLVEMLTELPLKQNIEPVPDLVLEKQRGQNFGSRLPGLQGYNDILSFWQPRLRCGTCAKVCVTAAVNPGLFYCQKASMKTDLWEMSKKLAAVCEYSTKESNQNTPENLGLLCAAKGKDGKWYRGFMQFLPVNSQVRVLFIDYGFFEYIKVDNIHRLPSEVDTTPIMAFPCSLLSLNDQDEVARARQLRFLKAGLLGKVLDVEIRGFDEEKHLYLITVTGAEDNHVKEAEPIQECPKLNVKSGSETGKLSSKGGHLYKKIIETEVLRNTLEAEKVQLDSVFVGYAAHVQDPHQFWIRTEKCNVDFEDMMQEMADHFRHVKLEEDVLLNPECGTLCCALYEKDMHFYRGVVTDVLEHGAEVLFIDFGNTEKVPHKLIKKMPKVLAGISAFAFCCSLVNVLPLNDVWTSNSCDFFRRAVSNKALLVHVVQMKGNKCVVELCETGAGVNQSVTELMISVKQAECWNSVPIELVLQTNTDVTEKTRRPRYSLTSDQKTEEEEEEQRRRNENKTQAPAQLKAISIKPGLEFAVCCSYVNSPSDFWCQRLDKAPDLEELMDKIQLYYSTHTVALQSGDSSCVAKSCLDGRWYRGFIMEKQEAHAKVLLVDYGCSLEVTERNLQGITAEYVHLEGQAFRCSLSNLIRPAEPRDFGNWSLEACNFLKHFVCNSSGGLRCAVVCQLTVKNKGLCNIVDLSNTQSQQSITNLLLQQGLAREVTVSAEQLSTGSPESFVFCSYDLRSGEDEQVYVTHVSSQCEVYCHLERNTNIIDELEKKISEESEKMMQINTRVVVRKLCLAKYLDGKWYRGLVYPVQSPLHLSVFFVDYGNTHISEKTHIMFIPKDSVDLLYTPMQALRCSLASVTKEELYADVKEWLDDAVLNKQVRARIVGKSEDGSFEVELFDRGVNINEKVNELIASLSTKPQRVVSSNISSRNTKQKTLHREDPKKSDMHKCQHRRQPSKPSTMKYVDGKAPIKVNKPNQKKMKSCVPVKPPKNTPVKQQTERRYANTKSDQPQCPERTGSPQLPCVPHMKVTPGFRALCFVSHVDSVDSFFLQLSEDEPAILKMLEDLNSGITRDSIKTTTPLRINDLVLAEFEEDGSLYRSTITDHEGSSCCKVEFVDYGNSAVISKDKIYSIPKEYISQPRLSIPCSLLHASTYRNEAAFTDAVMDKSLMVHFVCQRGAHWEVQVEILDVGLPAPLEAPVESETEKEVTAPASSCEIEERATSSGWDKKEKSENEATTTPTVDGEKFLLGAPLATSSLKLKTRTCRRCRRTPTRRKSRYEKHQRKTMSYSVKQRRDCAEALTSVAIRSKDTESCTVLSVQSDGSFYVRLKRADELLPALESHVAKNLHKWEMVAEEDVKQGLKCLVQGQEDKQWHRAVVQHVCQGKCQVLLLDHGITAEIPTRSIRCQCSRLTKIPNLAFLCKMDCCGFSEEEAAHKLWSETLELMIGSEVKLLFVSYSDGDELWKVEIIMDGLFLIRQISLQQNKGLMTLPAETINENTEGKSPPEPSPPQQLVFAPVDIDRAYSGLAAAVTNPVEFCIVLEDSLPVMSKVSIMLEDLSDQMSPLPEAQLVPGTCCLLKSDTNNKWCRAEVVRSDATAVLNLVDYGRYECTPCTELRRLPAELADLPKVAYPCTLRGVEPVRADRQWTDEAAFFFQQCLYQKHLQIFFREVESDTHWKVDVLADGVHVAQELVDAGHASYVDIVLGLRYALTTWYLSHSET